MPIISDIVNLINYSELYEYRTPTAKFRLNRWNRRRWKAEIHAAPIHFLDELGRYGGGYEDIDSRWQRPTSSIFTLEKSPYWARLSANFTDPDGFEYRSYGGDDRLNIRPLGFWWATAEGVISSVAEPKPVLGKLTSVDGAPQGKTVVYQEAFGAGIHCQVQARGTALVREMVIDNLGVLGEIVPGAEELWLGLEFRNDAKQSCKLGGVPVSELIGNRIESPGSVVVEKEGVGPWSRLRPIKLTDAEDNVWYLPLRWEIVLGREVLFKVIPLEVLSRVKFPIRVDDSLPYGPEAGDGLVQCQSAVTYAAARDAASGSGFSYTATTFNMGQGFLANQWFIYRGFVPFDTSSLPDDANITGVTFKFWVQSDLSTTDFNIGVVGTSQASTAILGNPDYDECGVGGTGNAKANPTLYAPVVSTDGISISAYTEMIFNSNGKNAISKTGDTLVGLRSERDYKDSGTAPGGSEYVKVYSSEQTDEDNDPVLIVDYTVANGLVARRKMGGIEGLFSPRADSSGQGGFAFDRN